MESSMSGPAPAPVVTAPKKRRRAPARPASPEWLVDMVGNTADRVPIATFAAQVGVATMTVRRWIAEGHIEATRVGRRRFMIDKGAVEKFVAAGRVGTAV